MLHIVNFIKSQLDSINDSLEALTVALLRFVLAPPAPISSIPTAAMIALTFEKKDVVLSSSPTVHMPRVKNIYEVLSRHERPSIYSKANKHPH